MKKRYNQFVHDLHPLSIVLHDSPFAACAIHFPDIFLKLEVASLNRWFVE